MRKTADQDRNHKPLKFADVEPSPPPCLSGCVEQACTGNEKEERHHPAEGKAVPYLNPGIGVGILDMPVVPIEKAGTVIDEDDEYGPYAKPVELILSN